MYGFYSGQRVITRKCIYTKCFVLTFVLSAFGQAPTEEVSHEDGVVLLAFIQLGNFSDRGYVGTLVDQDKELGDDIVVSPELLDLMAIRETNLSAATPMILPFSGAVAGHSPKETMVRLRDHGLIELLGNENVKLLDTPLSNRKELADRIKAIADRISPIVASLYAKNIPRHQYIVVAASLRQLSVELELEIVKSLSPAERTRLVKLVSFLLPDAIACVERANKKAKFGSVFLDRHF